MSKFQSIKSMGRQLRDIPDPAMRRRIETIMGNIEALGNSAEFLRDQAAASAGSGIITQIKWISTFGALPSNPDNSDAFGRAVDWLNDQTEPACLVFEAGIYNYATSPNWAVNDVVIGSCGVVRLRCTGSGDSFILDGGASILNMRVGRFFIEGHDGSGDGIYMRGIHHSYLDFNVRGCGTTQAGLRTEWCVVNKYHYICSGNEGGGFYNDGSGVAKPKYGAYLDDNASAQQTSYCLWIDPIIEGVEIGVHIVEGSGNQFNGGTIEGNTDWGAKVDSGCISNKFIGGDFEDNTNGDILVAGAETDIIGCDSDSLIQFSTGGRDSKIIGGANDSITIDSGLTGVKLQSTSYNRTGSGVLTDNGTNTRIWDLTNIGNTRILRKVNWSFPTSINLDTGTETSGNYFSTYAMDNSPHHITEVSGTPGFDIKYNYSGLVDFDTISFYGYYDGNPAHTVEAQVYDYTTAGWVTLEIIPSGSQSFLYSWNVNSARIISSGVARVRFYHSSSGTPGHDLYVDYLGIS